jgi:preprotein translocase subunit SecE
MKMVIWPSAKQNRHDTAIVITSSILFAAYLGALDWLFSWLTQRIM